MMRSYVVVHQSGYYNYTTSEMCLAFFAGAFLMGVVIYFKGLK